MKKYLLIPILMILFRHVSCAQNPEFPAEKAIIKLTSGKEIKETRLWKIYSDLLEYEKDGSLHDVPIVSIERLETNEGVYTIDSSLKLNKLPDDLIIMVNNDTITCLIKEIKNNPTRIHFLDRKSKLSGSVGLASVKKYTWNEKVYEFSSVRQMEQTITNTPDFHVTKKKKMTFGKVVLGLILFEILIVAVAAASDR